MPVWIPSGDGVITLHFSMYYCRRIYENAAGMYIANDCSFLQRAYVDGLHMKKFWSCFLLSVGVILCGLAIVKLVFLPDMAVCISALLCLLAVERLSDLYVINDADTNAMMYYFRQKKRVFILVTFLLIGLFDVHYSRGLLIILYAEVVMLVSTFAGFCKKHIYHKKKE